MFNDLSHDVFRKLLRNAQLEKMNLNSHFFTKHISLS